MEALHVMGGGAAQALVDALSAEFTQKSGMTIAGTFGAVGAMRDQYLNGAPADVLILSKALIDGLQTDGQVQLGSDCAVGVVATGLAVVQGQARVAVDTPQALHAALQNASAIYCPDPQKATAGIHFYKVLTELGLAQSHAQRLRTFPNGMTAMRAMASDALPGTIGCTQVTEIRFVPGVELVGLLPAPYELSTVYTAAITARSTHVQAAQTLMALLTDPAKAGLRKRLGFD